MIDFIIKYWVEFSLTSAIAGITYLLKQYVGLKYGMVALLRNEIVRVFNYQTEAGYCPSYMKENIKELYENYHKLGGNGMVTSMTKTLYELPNEKGRN